jgi:CRISPR-associated protein Cas1
LVNLKSQLKQLGLVCGGVFPLLIFPAWVTVTGGFFLPIERGYRQLSRYQQQLCFAERLQVARHIVQAKLKNSRVILMRQQRRQASDGIVFAIQCLEHLIKKAGEAETIEKLMGMEGAGAAQYFSAFEECLSHPDFVFVGRSRRPPGNPVNAMLSFGYQVLWNHLLSLIELQGLDPYSACLHQQRNAMRLWLRI